MQNIVVVSHYLNKPRRCGVLISKRELFYYKTGKPKTGRMGL